MALPSAELVHQLPGRLRLRIAARRGDAAFFARTAEQIRSLAPVREVAANPRTGSLLICHHGPADALLSTAEDRGLFRITVAAAAMPARRSGRAIALFAPSSAVAGLAGLALLQTARGQMLGSATENFWIGLRAFAAMGRPRTAALLGAFGLYRLLRGPALGSGVSLFYYALTLRELTRWRNPGKDSPPPRRGRGVGEGVRAPGTSPN